MNMKYFFMTLLFSSLSMSAPVFSWDPIGDITHPDRILRNAGRELDNAGREIDRIRLEAQAQTGAPVFQEWLNQSRNTAASGGASPIPQNIRQQLQGFYDEDTLNHARFKIGDGGVFNLANLSIQYGGAGAVTLIDIIVFLNAQDAYNNPILWAHELKHIQQFRDWGARDFAIRYIRSWNGVEGEAYAAENSYRNWSAQIAQRSNEPMQSELSIPVPPIPSIAQICATGFGSCQMMVGIPIGSQCYCQTYNGPIWGVAR